MAIAVDSRPRGRSLVVANRSGWAVAARKIDPGEIVVEMVADSSFVTEVVAWQEAGSTLIY